MIEKIFENSNCISCGKETPVVFVITDINEQPLYRLPLCRQCSDIFAKDRIDTLKKKLITRGWKNCRLNSNNISLKCKVKQMNIRSHRHKEVITELRKSKTNES